MEDQLADSQRWAEMALEMHEGGERDENCWVFPSKSEGGEGRQTDGEGENTVRAREGDRGRREGGIIREGEKGMNREAQK